MPNGFFIFCNINKEKKAFYEFLKETTTLSLNNPIPTVNSSQIFNFEAQLTHELEIFKKKKNFVLIEEFKSIIIVENRTSVLPSEIYNKIVNSSNMHFKYALRIVPIDLFTNIESDKIKSYILDKNFSGTYKVLFEGRLHDKATKEKIFKTIIPLINCKVKLVDPDFLVVIQAYKRKIGLTVIKNDYKNFNVTKESFLVKS